PDAGGQIDVVAARTEESMGSVPLGGPVDVDRAVAGAKDAFPAWAATPVADRVATLRRIADGLDQRAEELAVLMAREVGTPILTSRRVQVGLATDVFRSMADVLDGYPLETWVGHSMLVRQPAGVVGAITPWNYPLYQLAA